MVQSATNLRVDPYQTHPGRCVLAWPSSDVHLVQASLASFQRNSGNMKLIRLGEQGKEKPGVLLNETAWVNVSDYTKDYDQDFFADDGLTGLAEWLQRHPSSLAQVSAGERLGPPVSRPSKIVCVGLNFRDHAAESKMQIPSEPVLFFKATSSLTGPNDRVVIPRNAAKLDWEVELALIIGRRASYVAKKDAFQYVAGYALHNDYSERTFQLERGGQWMKGKSADTFAPLGPYLVTQDELPDPASLAMWLKVNGELRQNSNTANMIFDVPTLVSYVSEFMTLLPGDIISTGTPAGVGLGMHPPKYLRPGDVVELGIEKLGSARQQIVAWSSSA